MSDAFQTNEQPKSVFETLVGEGKKFTDEEALAKGKQESDAFIEQLKSENEGLRQELDKRVTAEEMADRILSSSNQGSKTEEHTSPSLSEKDIAELVQNTISRQSEEGQMKANESAVNEKLGGVYGDKAGEFVKTKAQELGVSVSFLKSVAQKSPEAFYKTVGLGEANKEAQPTITPNSVNTQTNTQTNSSGSRTWDDYKKMRKDNPRQYWSPAIQNEILTRRKSGELELPA